MITAFTKKALTPQPTSLQVTLNWHLSHSRDIKISATRSPRERYKELSTLNYPPMLRALGGSGLPIFCAALKRPEVN